MVSNKNIGNVGAVVDGISDDKIQTGGHLDHIKVCRAPNRINIEVSQPWPSHLKPMDASSQQLYHKLYAWLDKIRFIISKRRFYVLHEKAIIGIASRRPHTMEELLKVKGIGEVKLAQYGEALLKIVRDHEQSVGAGKLVKPLTGLSLVKRIEIS